MPTGQSTNTLTPRTVYRMAETKTQADQLSIVQAVKRDLELIFQWTLKLHKHEDNGYLEMNLDFYNNLKQWINQELTNPNSLYLIAHLDQSPAGFIAATTVINDNGFLASPMKGVVNLLWVEQQYREKNIAQTLLKKVESCFKDIGINHIECHYTVGNNLAKGFWAKSGYHEQSTSAIKKIK